MSRKVFYISIMFLVFIILLVVFSFRNNNADDWQLGDPNTVYTIQGVTDYGRGSTYYLYKQSTGNREVILVDPESTVDFTHMTDREVKITGRVISKNGVKMVRITWMGLAN